jgi:dihydrofolate reductase/thymidylate synthase
MSLNIIASVVSYKGKLAIGASGGLLARNKADMAFFKRMTTNEPGTYVLMGHKTYLSIPEKFRPLPDRINIVVTRNKKLWNFNRKTVCPGHVYFTSLEKFMKYVTKKNPTVYIIGGATIYNYFLDKNCKYTIDNIYLTHLSLPKGAVPDTFIDPPDSRWKIVGYTEPIKDGGRILFYKKTRERSQEYKYLDLMKDILANGNEREDRTGTGTVSVFGRQMRFDISKSIPLLTTKNVPWKMVLEELLWFCRGDTDAKILQERGIHIWDGNTSREFLDNRGLTEYPEGVLGAGYGWQIRHQGAKYNYKYANTQLLSPKKRANIGGFDQLAEVERLLKEDPYSRRIMMSYWNPNDFKDTALPPCHFTIMFYVEKSVLNAQFVMRSNDVLLGNPFNIASYAMLVYILAKRCGYTPGELIFTGNDVHLYKTHLEAVQTQLKREPRPFPMFKVSDNIITKDWHDITIDDFEVIGYFPYPGIKAPMAI